MLTPGLLGPFFPVSGLWLCGVREESTLFFTEVPSRIKPVSQTQLFCNIGKTRVCGATLKLLMPQSLGAKDSPGPQTPRTRKPPGLQFVESPEKRKFLWK
jgi:hypothetical protein